MSPTSFQTAPPRDINLKADDRTRTDNLLITNQLLCQLSHIGINQWIESHLIGTFNGRWWIRTTEGVASRFTVCPLWPLGNPPIYCFWQLLALSKKPMIGLEPITCWLQISCSAYNWLVSRQLSRNEPHRHKKWKLQGSNLWPSACKADALPAELNFQNDPSGTRTRDLRRDRAAL